LVEIDQGLKIDMLRYLIIDAGCESGEKTIFDIPQTVKPLLEIFVREDIRKRIADGKLRVVFY
jgi:hypothetical protein